MRRVASLFVSVTLALGTLAWVVRPRPAFAQECGYSADDEESAFVDLLNAYRGELGLAPVTLNSELGATAEYHSADMAANNYFSHYLFDGVDAGRTSEFRVTGSPTPRTSPAGWSRRRRCWPAGKTAPSTTPR